MFANWRKMCLVAVAALGFLLTPATSEAQRGRGGNAGRSPSVSHGTSSGWNQGGGGNRDGGRYRGNYGYGFGIGYPGYYGYGYGPYSGYGYSPSYGYGGAYSDYSSSPTYSFYPDSAYMNGTQSAMSSQLQNPNDAGFTVRVPDPNAQVWFQDHQTQQGGTVRQYESAPLAQGYTYTFTIRAQWNQNGQALDQTREVNARAGQNVMVDFSQPAPEQIPGLPQRQNQGQFQPQGQQNFRPQQNLPQQKMPLQNLPQQNLPQQNLPQQNLPQQNLPQNQGIPNQQGDSLPNQQQR
jgi:uncharacterized protein (TIGR03000 family)